MNRFILILFVTFMVSALGFGQRAPQPPTPYVDRGACPFECCTYRSWTVDKPTAIRAGMSDGSPLIYQLKRGEKVTGVTGVVITTQPGILKVLKETQLDKYSLKRGDRLYLLTYLGEGFHEIWFKGRIFQGDPYDEATYKSVRETKSTWWVKIKNRRGRIGWSRQPENFGNKDQCG
jgi:hypothetical protein